MKLKTTLPALLTVALLCGTLAFAAVANADLELSASSELCMPGETVTIDINIDQNPGFYYLGVYLDYDTEALELVSVKNASALSLTAGRAYIWTANGTDDFTGTGLLATMTFTVKEDAPDGEYEVGIRIDWSECYNAYEDDVTISFTKGVIKVCSHTETASEPVSLPTCTKGGENIIRCASCGAELSRESVSALGHTPGDWVVETDATCTKAGVEIKVCSVCGETVESRPIPVKDHTPGEWTTQVEATCTAGGVDVKTCTVCQKVIETATTPMIAHDYDNGVITTAPTCVKEGVLTFTCTACGHSYTEPIAKAPHTYDELGICTVCSAKSALYISADAVRARNGETVSVTVSLDRNAGAAFLSLIIDYDETALELVSVDNGNLFDLTQGRIYVFSKASNVTATGALVTLNFAVKETAEADVSYPIAVTVYECYSEDEAEVDACAGNGSVYVYNFIYGDANGDGKLNGQDATRLLRYLANYDPFTGTSSLTVDGGADANGDGKINGQDATRLLRYLANYDPLTGDSSVTLGPSE